MKSTKREMAHIMTGLYGRSEFRANDRYHPRVASRRIKNKEPTLFTFLTCRQLRTNNEAEYGTVLSTKIIYIPKEGKAYAFAKYEESSQTST